MSTHVLIEDISPPFEVSAWDSRREALAHLPLRSRHLVEVGGEDQLPGEYLCICSNDLVALVGLEIAGVQPHVFGLEDFGLWLIGCNTTVYVVELASGLVIARIDLTVPFSTFMRLAWYRVLVVFETGVLLLDRFGSVVWRVDRPFGLLSHCVQHNRIHLSYEELGSITVDGESGVVQDPA